MCEGHVYAEDTDGHVRATRWELANMRGIYSGNITATADVLPPYAKPFLAWHMEQKNIKNISNYVGDLAQDPEKRPRTTTCLPAMSRGSMMLSLSSGSEPRIFTPRELAFAHGWPSLDFSGCREYKYLLSEKFESLPYTKACEVLGNGVHLPCMTAWFMFVASHTIRRESLLYLAPPLQMSDVGSIVEVDVEEDEEFR